MILLVNVLVAFILLPSNANACSCAPAGSPCEEFGESTAVFIGNVTSGEDAPSGKNYSISVEEVFKGKPGTDFQVFSCFQCMCDFGFEFSEGKRYIIYAFRYSNDRWRVSACGRTNLLAKAKEDMEFLRSLPQEGTGGRLYGEIAKDYSTNYKLPEDQRLPPMPKIPLTIEGNGQRFDLITDDKGRYEFSGLKPGRYRIQILLLDGLQAGGGNIRDVKVYDRSCTRAPFYVGASQPRDSRK